MLSICNFLQFLWTTCSCQFFKPQKRYLLFNCQRGKVMFPYAYIQTHAHRVFTYTKQKYSLQILIEHFQNSTREYCIWYHIYIISKWICVNELAPSHHLYYVSNFLALFVVVNILKNILHAALMNIAMIGIFRFSYCAMAVAHGKWQA